MKIGILTGEYPPMQGGVGDFSHELAAALLELDYQVHVITRLGCGLDQDSQGVNAPRASSITVHPIASDWGWRTCARAMELVRHLGLDVLNLQYQAAAYDLHPAINFLPWHASLSGLGRGSLYRPNIVVTFHDLKVPYLFPKAGPLRDWVVTMLARKADATIVTNRADELALTARRVERVRRIPIGSNIAPVLPDGYDRQAWRAGLGIAPEDRLLSFFGFLNEHKGVETLIRALAALDKSHHLLFIGGTVGSSDATNQVYARHVQSMIADMGLIARVHYTGFVPAPEVSAAFAAVDLCILPYADGISFHHGTLMAALAHGRPIISTRPSIELPELATGENVWLVPPGDTDALVAAIRTLVADPERRRRLEQGATELSAQFSWERIAARTAELFGAL